MKLTRREKWLIREARRLLEYYDEDGNESELNPMEMGSEYQESMTGAGSTETPDGKAAA